MLKAIQIYFKSITRRKVKKISKLLKEKSIEKENGIGKKEKIRISIRERLLEVTDLPGNNRRDKIEGRGTLQNKQHRFSLLK